MYSPRHCCNLSPKAGTSQLRYHSVPVGFGAGVRDAFSSAKVSETPKGADFRLVSFSINSIWGIAACGESTKQKEEPRFGGKRTLHLADGKIIGPAKIMTQKLRNAKNETSTIQHGLIGFTTERKLE